MVARVLEHQQGFPQRAAGLIVDGTLFKSLDFCRGCNLGCILCVLGFSQSISAVTYHHWCAVNIKPLSKIKSIQNVMALKAACQDLKIPCNAQTTVWGLLNAHLM